MRQVIVRGFLSRKLRSALTAIAILLGVAMIAGSFVLTDKINEAFTNIFESGNENVDVVVQQENAFSSDQDSSNVQPFDQSVLETVEQVPGVAIAAGAVDTQGFLVKGDKKLKSAGGAPSLLFSAGPPEMSPLVPVDGTLPTKSGEVAVLEQLADDEDLTVGEQLQLSTDTGLHPVTISGITKFADVSSIGGATVVIATLPDIQQWYDLQGQVSRIEAKAEPGLSQEELAQRVRQAVPPTLTVQTGEQNAKDNSDDVADDLSFLNYLLLTFGGIAVVVGAFIIFNTFSITVAQRTREFGMLRTIGASRRQVLGAVLAESLIVGAIATALGFVGGILFAQGLTALFDAVGFGIPASGIPIKGRTIFWSVAVGLGVSVLAAVIPAIRATRVTPVAALREGVQTHKRRRPWIRPVVAVLVFALSGLLLNYGINGTGPLVTRLLIGLAGGALLFFFAMALIATYIVRPVVFVLGLVIRRLGAPGQLASENATRNTGRTAITAAALMIGTGMVVFVTILVSGIKDSFAASVDRSVRGDLILSAETFGANIPREAVTGAEKVDGVDFASPIGVLPARFDGDWTNFVIGVDPERLNDVYRFDWTKGDDGLIGQMGTNGALVEDNIAKDEDLNPGSTLSVETQAGETTTLKVLGTFNDPNILNGIVISNGALQTLLPPGATGINYVLIKDDDGADPAKVQAGVEQAMEAYPIAKVQSNQQLKEDVESQINVILYIFYALLALIVVISLFGIVNTLVLSVYERTREIGMIRAIGTTRRQLRRMIRYESVITAVIGGLLGVAVGIIFGYVLSTALEDEGLTFVLPIGSIIFFMILAMIAGVLAAIFPARRATKLNILEALQYE